MRCGAIVFLLLFPIIASGQTAPADTRTKVWNVENGLVEFQSPESIVNPGKFDLPQKKSIETRMKDHKVPGVSLTIIENREIIYAKGYGVLSVEAKDAVATDTIFQAASTSKFVTAVIVLHYVQNGLLDLDKDVNTYLKRWKVPDNQFTQTQKVTLRRLLTHQAGLPATNLAYDEQNGTPTLLNVVKGEIPARNKPAVPDMEPGSQWRYSNVGYNLIQMVLEDTVGKPFARIARDLVFSPLGMNASTFTYPLEKAWSSREALPHDDDGKVRKPQMHPSALAQGGLMTTPTDLSKFAIECIGAYQGRSGKILNQEYARKLFNRELDLDPKIFGLPLGEGLGVLLFNKADDVLFAHPGSNVPGSNCWLIASAKTGKGAVIMTNGAPGEILGIEILTAISREFHW